MSREKLLQEGWLQLKMFDCFESKELIVSGIYKYAWIF